MKFREFTKNDYELVVSWWKHYGDWALMPYEYLSATSYVVVDENDKPMTFASLYLTNSPFAVLEWITADPTLERQKKDEALDMLLCNVLHPAKANGCKLLHTSTRIQSLIDRLRDKHNYFNHDANLTALFTAVDYEEMSKNL